jgi:hypothetical protein
MTLARYQSALAMEGVAGVLLEVVDEALSFAAAQHPAIDNRSLYAYAAELRYRVREAETLYNAPTQ